MAFLRVIYRAGELLFAAIGFEEGEAFLASQTEISLDSIGTQTGLTAWFASGSYRVAASSDPTALQWVCETAVSADCSDLQSTVLGSSVVVDSVGSGDWQTLTASLALPASAASAYCGLQKDSAATATVRLDALRFIAPLYADRF